MSAPSIERSAAPTGLAAVADGLAIAVAVVLPWSVSLTAILILLWLLALVPTLDLAALRREIARPAGGLPVALFVLGALGMAWADVSWAERLGGLDSFFKLLTIPLLFVQFRRGDGGLRVMVGYLASCTALLALSILALATGKSFMLMADIGVPVRNATTQVGEFVTCLFALLFLAIGCFRSGRRSLAAGLLALAFLFLADIVYLAAAPTAFFTVPLLALISIPVLLVLLGFKKFNARGMRVLLAAGAVLCAVAWISSPQLRDRTMTVWDNIRPYPGREGNWAGTRPEFWRKSLIFIGEAPILGHGTGSIHTLFVRSAAGQSGHSAFVTANPNQQTFTVGIELGLAGIAVLWAMWLAHLRLFRGSALPEWIGLVVVTQNIVGSLLDSTLFQSTEGWSYVFGVGVAGGMVHRLHANEPAP
jgi:O-antigen ligase